MATKDDYMLRDRMASRGITLTLDQCRTLRLAEITLHRWAEGECGDSNDWASWSIERDEETNIPYRVTYPHTSNTVTRTRIADKETRALARVANLCTLTSLHFYQQTDPRGCALYISATPFTDHNYTDGIACSV